MSEGLPLQGIPLEDLNATLAAKKVRSKAQPIRLCLPQLSINGLSETWLLKQCGAIHWEELSTAFGVPPESMSDGQGNRLYPSFIALRLKGGPLSAFREGDNVRFAITLEQVSRTRYLSRQCVQTDTGSASVSVEMLTSFLRREKLRDNSVLTAGDLRSMRPIQTALPKNRHCDLVEVDQVIRSCKWTEHEGYMREPSASDFTFRYAPSPFSDFNGAGLLYFAQYQDIVDRAEWALHGETPMLAATTVERQLFYFANCNPGDSVQVSLMSFRATGDGISYRAQLTRCSDSHLMAEVFTRKCFDAAQRPHQGLN